MVVSQVRARSSIWEVLSADLVEGGPVEGGAELVGVLWGRTESALQGGIFASGDESVVVEVLNVEDLLDGLEAGSAVGLGSQDWEGSLVGGSCDDAFLEVAGEGIVEAEELVGEDVSSHGNGGEDDVAVDGGDEVVKQILLRCSSVGIVIARVSLWVCLLPFVIIVVSEEVDELVGSLSERPSGDHDGETGKQGEGDSLDGLASREWGLNTLASSGSLGQSGVDGVPQLHGGVDGDDDDNEGPEVPEENDTEFHISNAVGDGGPACVLMVITIREIDASLNGVADDVSSRDEGHDESGEVCVVHHINWRVGGVVPVFDDCAGNQVVAKAEHAFHVGHARGECSKLVGD